MNNKDTGILLLDSSDKPFFTFFGGRDKKTAPLSSIAKITQQAAIATEDKDFYFHPGFSPKAIIGAAVADLEKGELAYGGSTITQQLIKNSLLSSNKSFVRKLQEIVLAIEMEQRFSKDEILEMYLNTVYFGEGAFGIEEAALTYFNKNAKDLNLAQSALLIGLLPSPSKFSPINGDLKAAQERQKYVLQKMLEEKYITLKQKEEVEKEKLTFQKSKEDLNLEAIHFAFMVKDSLVQKYGEKAISDSGFKVKTTLNSQWQKEAEAVVVEQVKRLAINNVSNGAVVVIDPKTGEIKALVGSKNWFEEKFGRVNVATSPRQPGSSFKPVYYSYALDKHIITPATILQDKPVSYGGPPTGGLPGEIAYKPVNYDRRFRGPVTVRRALSNSLNVPSVEVMTKVGVEQALDQSKLLGLSTLDDHTRYGLSLALGAGEIKLVELTNAYAAFASSGLSNKPTTVLEIRDKKNRIIYSYTPFPERVLSTQASFLISSILSDEVSRSEVFGNLLNISRPAAVKTGTSENYKDSLTVGFTSSLTIGVWVGNNDGTPMDNIAGSLGAAPIWKNLMEKFLSGTPVEQFEVPEGIVAVNICRANGLLYLEPNFATSNTTNSAVYREYFIKGTEPTQLCSGREASSLGR